MNTPTKQLVSEMVNNILSDAGISRAELARRLGVSQAWVCKLLRPNHNWTLDTLDKVLEIAGAELAVAVIRPSDPWYEGLDAIYNLNPLEDESKEELI